jgi:hypothetical protein
MRKIPFSEAELEIVREIPSFRPGMPAYPIYNSPIPAREHYINIMTRHEYSWLTSAMDELLFAPRCFPENEARSFIVDGGSPAQQHTDGYKDIFGVEWVYVPVAGGAMVRPGNPLMLDANDWKDVVKLPPIANFDWDAQDKISKPFLADTLCAPVLLILSGFFERLIALMDFDRAAVAMIDEDQKEAVKELFDALADYYIEYIDLCVARYGIVGVHMHDDWGSQRAPFYSPATCREMLVPAFQKLTGYLHARGMFFELHSCGEVDLLVPCMVEAGVDLYHPQLYARQSEIYAKFRNEDIVLGLVPPAVDVDASREDVYAAAQKFVDEFVNEGSPVIISNRSFLLPQHPLMREALYVLSRKKLSK